jgi:hypothetical protein
MEDGLIGLLDLGSTAVYTVLLVSGDTPAILLILCLDMDEYICMSTSGCCSLLGKRVMMPRVVALDLAFNASIVVCV